MKTIYKILIGLVIFFSYPTLIGIIDEIRVQSYNPKDYDRTPIEERINNADNITVMLGSSMEDTYSTGDIGLIKNIDYNNFTFKRNQILCYEPYEEINLSICHRVVWVFKNTLITKGDSTFLDVVYKSDVVGQIIGIFYSS